MDSLQTWYLESHLKMRDADSASAGSQHQSPLQDTVELLTDCRADELSRLEALKGSKKLLAVYR